MVTWHLGPRADPTLHMKVAVADGSLLPQKLSSGPVEVGSGEVSHTGCLGWGISSRI